MHTTSLTQELVERFFRYVAISSQSDASNPVVPTSPGQRVLAELLADELRQIGAIDVVLDDYACLTARFPGTLPGPALGFCAHLDTVDVGLSPDIYPQLVRFSGQRIELGHGQVLDPRQYPVLEDYLGEDIICTDGSSVLGSDDKAALASIMTALSHLGEVEHRDIVLAFVPDEEIGLRGAKALDLTRFAVAGAYTVDCEGQSTIAYETFNAGQAIVEIAGVTAHPMSAKGVLVNPNLVAHDLISCFDRNQTPECTAGREGYIWVQGIDGNQARTIVTLNIRDHDKARYEERKTEILRAVAEIEKRHPRAQISCQIDDVYANIADALKPENQWVVQDLQAAVLTTGRPARPLVMRGGTDGSYLSTQGIPTPNIFTGGFNFHSVHEFLPVSEFYRSYRTIWALMTRQF
ncbi:peptidase T [Arcanobacterium pinnipediorum]|uniref:Peptidase T n=1 Tax=Arcanobacterium pinnipediorum TaxID=1503041 RepID=A0ABY5AG33_9ACTO|nr:peptidase T [Arcanobacterium pinnipediorum]USR79157.1 peptidase T [Arcanobacterium pinnipediorum]